jgi:hypothetical protein
MGVEKGECPGLGHPTPQSPSFSPLHIAHLTRAACGFAIILDIAISFV